MDMHDGNRLELIERYKKQLVESTNIKSSPDEMAVIDSILFRFWQMGWLKEYKAVSVDTKMTDKNTVMGWLEGLAQDDWRQWHSDSEVQETAKAALALLKEKEALPADNGKCPSCNWDFENGELDFSNINESRFYCPRCGQAVKWE